MRSKPKTKAAAGARKKTKPRKRTGAAGPRRKPVRGPSESRAIEAAMAALAHDIRTPLTGILALAELLSASELAERERQWARNVKSAAEHLSRLTTLVCDAVRADSSVLVLRRDMFSPRRLAQTLAETLAARAEISGLTSHVEIAENLPPLVIGDSVRLRAAMENLIDNAVKFTARGGITLSVAAKAAGKGMKLNFSVTDSGIGMTADEIGKLFRPFAQANESISHRFGGTGLGLVLVRRIARAMGGDLTVSSAPGIGSTFALSALVARADRAGPKARASRPGTMPGRSGKSLAVLCAEDNPYGRVVLNAVLSELGHQADFVGSGAAAVEAAARGRHDLILMDVALPGLDGIEATRRIRALEGTAGRVPVIGISALTSPEDRARAKEAGMNDYLEKPVTPAMLVNVLGKTGW